MAAASTADMASSQKATNKREWGRTAEQYAGNMHQGPGMMMPLISQYTAALTGKQGKLSILDVAAGSGEPTLSIAKEHPDSHIMLTDLAPEMVAQAEARAKVQGVSNVRFQAADAEDLSHFSDKSFDVVTCNCGLMFMPHPDKALSEFHRVLKPNGKLMLSVWTPPETFQFFSLVTAMQQDIAPNETFFAQPSNLGHQDKLLALVRGAGFSSPQCKEVNVPMTLPTARVRAAFLDNAVCSELLNRLQAAGQADVYDRAEKSMLAIAAQRGFIKDEGSTLSVPHNVALFVEAHA